MALPGKDQEVKSAKLVWRDEGEANQEYIFSVGTDVILGREVGCDIVLTDKLVSKKHAMLSWRENAVLITDQNSANGTLVNGKKISEAVLLKDSDRIEIGETVISYYFLGEQMDKDLKTVSLPRGEGTAAGEGQAKDARMTMNLVEDMPTIAPEQVSESSVPEKQDTPPASRKAQTAASKAIPSAPAEDPFKSLLEQIQAAQASGKALQKRWQNTKSKLEEITERLSKMTPHMAELGGTANEVNLIKLLDNLAANPNDINLLVELAHHAALISKVVKGYYNQESAINMVIKDLEDELNYYRGE